MKKADIYVEKTEKFVSSLQDEMKFELVDVEFVKELGTYYLRVYCAMDKEGGISIDDCVDISRRVSDFLDKEDFIEEEYILEVSSPGLLRALKKDKDLQRELGKKVKVKLFKSVDKKKEFIGNLKDFNKDEIILCLDNEDLSFDRQNIASIKLEFDF